MSLLSGCCAPDLDIPALSSATNIILDFRLNVLYPNTNILYNSGPSFSILQNNVSQIQDKLTEIIHNVNPSAPVIYRNITYGLFLLFFIVVLMMIISFAVGGAVLFVGIVFFIILFVSIVFYIFWVGGYSKQWREKVLSEVMEYAKNEFKKTYSQAINIHILHPIKVYRSSINRHRHHISPRGHTYRRSRMVANWIVIRITNGPIQQPINAPVYWSSNGTIMQPQIPIIIQPSQQPITTQQQPTYQQTPQVYGQQQQIDVHQLKYTTQQPPTYS